MSFHEIDQQPEMRPTNINNHGPFCDSQDHIPQLGSPSVTSQTDMRGNENQIEPIKGLGIGPFEENLKEKSMDASSNFDDLKSTNFMCRICFSDENEKEDPLISPCKCRGSMMYVHLKCLRQWLSRNENKKIAPHVTSYTWKAFHCELCKSKLEDHYKHGNDIH
jgi:hypothetical protein